MSEYAVEIMECNYKTIYISAESEQDAADIVLSMARHNMIEFNSMNVEYDIIDLWNVTGLRED